MSLERKDHAEATETPEQKAEKDGSKQLGKDATGESEKLRQEALGKLDSEHQTPEVKDALNAAQKGYLEEVSKIEKGAGTLEEKQQKIAEATENYKEKLTGVGGSTQAAEAERAKKQTENMEEQAKNKKDRDEQRATEAPQNGNDGMRVHADYSKENEVKQDAPKRAGAEGGSALEIAAETLRDWPNP